MKQMRIAIGALCSSILCMSPLTVHASPILVTGTPANAYTLPATPVSPNLGDILINFDSTDLTTTTAYNTVFSPFISGEVDISSPDGLVLLPYSTQSGPNELFDDSGDGSADLTIGYAAGAVGIGVGIADSDVGANGVPVNIVLQALNANGTALGSAFTVTLPETGNNPGNGYFVVEDSIPDIFGLRITQSVGNSSLFSGLAIDDVQVEPTVPEPSTLLLVSAWVALFGAFRARRGA